MKRKLYDLLLNRVPQIRTEFRQRRRPGTGRVAALFLLLKINLRYYLLPGRRRASQPSLPAEMSESGRCAHESPQALARTLSEYDVISFDVFDTLLLRCCSAPEDVFDLVGMEFSYPDFKHLRMAAEAKARTLHRSGEVTLAEIWALLERQTGIPANRGMASEIEWEKRCCSANPYMLQVVRSLDRQGKTIIAASDMYLDGGTVRELLRSCGYPAFDRLYVSCECGESKHSGTLYDRIRRELGTDRRYIHMGDNPLADRGRALEHGWDARLYQNVNRAGNPLRTRDMSPIVGSLYRGTVNAHLYSGAAVYSRAYEYGFTYGGLFTAGYCRFIHDYSHTHGIEKLLFLARDGAALLQAYRMMYPAEAARTCYAYWSRAAAVKLSSHYFRNEYFRRFLIHQAGAHRTVRQVLLGMELDGMIPALCRALEMKEDAPLTHKTAIQIQEYLLDHWEQVQSGYAGQIEAGKKYYAQLLDGCRSAAAIDIGWAGSGAVMLDCMVNRVWGLSCPITGILAGSDSALGPEPDTAEPMLFGGRLVSYLYSSAVNRDLWKTHDPAKGHNLYWELLLSAPEGSLKGFYPDGDTYRLRFRENRAQPEQIREIHRGILDFVRLFLDTEARLGVQIPVSGRDAYAPMLPVLHGRNQKFMRSLEALLDDAQIS